MRVAEAGGAGATAASDLEGGPPRTAAEPDERAERGVVRGLQGPVQDARRVVLLPADGDGRVQPVPSVLPGAGVDTHGARQASIHAAIRGVRTSGGDSYRQ